MQKDFEQTAGNNDFAPFKLVLGKMLRSFGEISSDDYDLVGQVQAQTVVLAETFETAAPEQRTKILDKFGGRDWKTKEPTGKLDINSAIFTLKKENAVAELNDFLQSLGIEKVDERLDDAVHAVFEEKGVHPNAAASAVVLKALCLSDYDRDAKQAIVDASLIMQMSLRGLDRIAAFSKGEYNRQAALDLQNLSNKLNYKFDPKPLVDANESLLFICATEMRIHTQMQNTADMDIHELQKRYELALKADTQTLVESMPAAAELYKKAGKTALAAKAEAAYLHFKDMYADILDQPHILNAPAPADTNTSKPEFNQ